MARSPREKTFFLRAVLEKLNLSQRQLAKRLGMDATCINRFIRGTFNPSWPTAVDIARALGVSVGVFLPGDPAYLAFFEVKGEAV